MSGLKFLDCGDIPVTAYDNALALSQMTMAFLELGSRPPLKKSAAFPKVKLLALGGDHSVALPALRSLNTIYGSPVTVLHFDAHLDTWDPIFPSPWETEQTHFNHGSVFWLAVKEGLIHNGSSGFMRITADDIDEIGTQGIIEAIIKRIGTTLPVYLSFDIDVLDPSVCPGTGTPESGGWTSREVIKILRGLESLNVVGADILEVAPAYDSAGEQTALVAAQVAFEILASWAGRYMANQEQTSGSEPEKNEL
ncbi:Arginase/deacetylase [Glarea lozoyensis ATCC 20868]|uniref:Arginase/deacetylase n=1 Tax=Glarea lozoyensis (strain ATCC 20868 / MF5171) TaxID=1116229 RepID=S3DDL4_GLAL2|nr:Arginase/deacetylase [Glarea lozoyensis ATCC 20868]EPE35800.1 Arginase/deacetylase [Glarea lozoyensis ATCC 20868]